MKKRRLIVFGVGGFWFLMVFFWCVLSYIWILGKFKVMCCIWCVRMYIKDLCGWLVVVLEVFVGLYFISMGMFWGGEIKVDR